MRKMPAARAGAGVTVACGVLALITSCSSSPRPAHGPSAAPNSHATASGTTAASPAPAAPAAQLTPAQARQAFAAFFPRYDAMVSTHDVTQVPQLTTGAEAQVRAFGVGKQTGLPAPAQMTERFYVPRLAAYPRWFVEQGTTRSHGAPGGDLFVMVQSRPGGPWQEAHTLMWTGPAPAPLPGISTDPDGYATAVVPGETSLVTGPGQLPVQYALLISGRAGAASSRYAPGDATTGWIASQQTAVQGAPAAGWQVSFGYTAPAVPAYALRTTAGGALVFFAFDQASTWTARSSAPKFSVAANSFDGRMPVNVAFDAGLNGPQVRPGTRFASTYRFESLALDPARRHGKISLLPSALNGGGITSAAKG